MNLKVERLTNEKEIEILNVSYGIIWHLAAELFLGDDEENDFDEDVIGIHLKPEYDNFSRYTFK